MIFFSKTTNGFYDDSIVKTLPKDVVEISSTLRDYLLLGQSQGKILSSDTDGNPILVEGNENSTIDERAWRDSELRRSDIELFKVQDSDTKSVGSVAQWREYRKALRSWPENPNFPNKDFRPKAPDYKE